MIALPTPNRPRRPTRRRRRADRDPEPHPRADRDAGRLEIGRRELRTVRACLRRAESTPEVTPPASVEPSVEPTPEATPILTPEPTLSANLAIVSGVKVVGQSAAYSPDGAWFAFTARPSDGSDGPDIYVWRVGDQLAEVDTSDHASVFGSWAGNRLIGSRVAAGTAESFFIDPASGDESAIDGSVWRPIVDPAEHWAVTWDGTVTVGQDSETPVVGDGSLVLRGFSDAKGVDTEGKPAAVVAEGPFAEFDVRWDETGSWLAVWVADGNDPSHRPAEPAPARSGHRRDRSAARRAARHDGAPRVLDRQRASRLGDPARPGRRGEPRPDRRLDRRFGRCGRERSRRERGGHPLEDRRRPDVTSGRDASYGLGLVRPNRLVVGSVLTAALALVALPGLVGSRTSIPIEPVPAGAFQQFSVLANTSRSTATIEPLDDAHVSGGTVDAQTGSSNPARRRQRW